MQRIDAITEVRARIERMLHIRSAEPGTELAKIEQVAKTWGLRAWAQLKKRPSLGVAATGATTLALASTFGFGELALAMLTAYAAYQILRVGIAPEVALKELVASIENVR
jgi:hypothetical protein